MKATFITASLLLIAITLPNTGFAAPMEEPFEVSGWIPYWRTEAGVGNTLANMDVFTEVNPFVYTVRQDGELFDTVGMGTAQWADLQKAARERGVRFVPTVMWANADAMDEVFRDTAKRQEHVRSILMEVYGHGFDGIDIDYEAKYARTRPHFSLFLKELHEAMGYDKWIMCTIEARTPLESRYSSPESIPADIEYANDFSEINKYCDRVRIMAYDQGRIDLKLNDENGNPYAPVADAAWVEKVMRLAAEEIDKEKLVIGVPTYGYEYDVFEALDGSGDTHYSRLWSLNLSYALEVADKLNLTPKRSPWGELSLIYPAKDSPDPIIPLPFATRIITWSDAGAIQQKVELARELGLRGVAIFKIDGGEDPQMWNVLAELDSVRDSGE